MQELLLQQELITEHVSPTATACGTVSATQRGGGINTHEHAHLRARQETQAGLAWGMATEGVNHHAMLPLCLPR